jgi:hypothetical protein
MSGWPYANQIPTASTRDLECAAPWAAFLVSGSGSGNLTFGYSRPAAAAPRITRYTPPWQSCGGSAYNRVAMTGTRAGFERSATGPTTIHDYSGRGRSGRVPPTPKSARNGVHGL